ncbi:MAG: hypothetical protein Fur0021_35760 [Candidatus Promineifilaceae bacterium]
MPQAELTRQSLIAYRQRWQVAAAMEANLRESSDLDERWRQLNALFRVAQSLNILPPAEEIGLDEGRQRWQLLYAHEQVI